MHRKRFLHGVSKAVADANRSRRVRSGIILVIAMAATSTAVAASPSERCNVQLAIELTPDVPKPQDPAFLSSLLSNNVSYRLMLQQQQPGSIIVVQLTGPGPDYRCQNVIETLRKDGRVLSVHEQ
jgi:hypothetical protein